MSKLLSSVFIALTLLLSSCNLLDFAGYDNSFDLDGTWRLVGGVRHRYVYSTNEVISITDHFSNSDSSNLSISGSGYQINAIYLDSTTWSFKPSGHNGQFWLDYPNNRAYTLDAFRTYMGNNTWFETWGVYSYPEIGASKIVIQLESGYDDTMVIKVGENSEYVSDNEKTYSILTFEKVASW